MPVPNPTPIYHFTHIDNLARILRSGGLLCHRQLRQKQAPSTSIAYQHIQDRRDLCAVPCGSGGNLHDYIPFYFAPRSPMLYTIHRGNVAGIQDQKQIIYLVSTIQAVAQAGLPYVFTDGHAVVQYTSFYTDLQRLDQVDWDIMQGRYWYDTPNDPDRKRRRQAEFLVYREFPFSLVHEIGVYHAEMRTRVETILQNSDHKPAANLRQNWYY
jgi:hypothetical protein